MLEFLQFSKKKRDVKSSSREKKKRTNWRLCFKVTSIRLLYDFLLQSYAKFKLSAILRNWLRLFAVTTSHETTPHDESKRTEGGTNKCSRNREPYLNFSFLFADSNSWNLGISKVFLASILHASSDYRALRMKLLLSYLSAAGKRFLFFFLSFFLSFFLPSLSQTTFNAIIVATLCSSELWTCICRVPRSPFLRTSLLRRENEGKNVSQAWGNFTLRLIRCIYSFDVNAVFIGNP